ncbi:transcriptional regulator GutM [Xylocopilactobacillus apicola]|uniref:Glucitol operon activator n=1 Tax=Xylocopilactobacillus apicola TaxID=2932184 RepID=A0AAU9CW71_9LACO|nr:transcriptional regulator GutM [Xylocopilactobacillus apicola]BDR58214.1 glucitol operon activator [Xylocopilactobacillus apicola]
MLIFFGLVLVGAFILQGIMGLFQIKDFTKRFNELHRKGKVLIGKNPKKFRSGTLMLISIDDQTSVIKEAQIMKGVTVFAKFHQLPQLKDQSLVEVAADYDFLHQLNPLVRQCLLNAYSNFINFKNGTLSPSEYDTRVNVFSMPAFVQIKNFGERVFAKKKTVRR